MRARAALALVAGAFAVAGTVPVTAAADLLDPPLLDDAWSSEVASSSARLSAEINPNGSLTTYHFDYLTEAAFQANLAAGKDGFAGALRSPLAANVVLGSEPVTLVGQRQLFGLSAATAYRYRVVAQSPAGTSSGTASLFVTQSVADSLLLDLRGWEIVSPVRKSGGQVDPPGAIAGGGLVQAAAAGGALTYSSRSSFGAPALGAPPAGQYFATRAAGGWTAANLSSPIFSGSYDTDGRGVPYQLFSPDLARSLLLNGEHCRGEEGDCAVANPPLAGTDAPPGYQNYYLRESASGAFTALLDSADIAGRGLDPATFDLTLAGASADLRHVLLSTCSTLTPAAIEAVVGGACDPARPNLYEWNQGAGLSLVNIPPAQSLGAPGAVLAVQSTAVSEDGARIYWRDLASGNLYLREAGETKLVDGEGGAFQAASADGSVAFFIKASHLWRYSPSGGSADLTPAGGVVGVLGASADATHVYFQDADGLRLWHDGTTTTVAAGLAATDPGDYPPSTATARVGAGGRLLFVSSASLTGYDNTDLNSGEADSQVFLYDPAADLLTCLSCNPTNERPIGPSTIPGARANGSAPASIHAYKPRSLSADGRRVFFESRDALVLSDTNSGAPDVYQWEGQGEGSCTRPGGCLALISSGRSPSGATFLDASEDGADAYFLTDASLVGADPGAIDAYDARIGGGFPEPPLPIPCHGDACQALPSGPVDPTLTTRLAGPGNPAVRYKHRRHHKRHGKRHRKHRRDRGGRR